MVLSAAAASTLVQGAHTMQLPVSIQGHQFLFLVDSGSSSCFIDLKHASSLEGKQDLRQSLGVQVAGGAII